MTGKAPAPPPATRRPRARKGEGDRLRGEILVATERLLLETGSEEQVSIRAVASATGVTPPSIYRHFEDKTHLLFEVCARQLARLDAALEGVGADADDPIGALRALGRAYVRFGMEHPEHYRIMFMGNASTTPGQWADLLATGSFAQLVAAIETAVDSGHLEPAGDPFTTALHVWANIHGLTSLLVARPTMPWPDLDDFIDEHLALCVRAHVGAAGGGPSATSARR